MKKPLSILLGLVLVLSMLVLAGCNIFGWTSGESANSLLLEGHEAMQDGNCELALEKYEAAKAEDILWSEARYYVAKASLCAAGFNILELGTMMSDSDQDENEVLPFTASTWAAKVNDLYKVAFVICNELQPIYDSLTHGDITADDIDLEYAIGIGIKALLMFQDTDNDSDIDGDDCDLSIQYVNDTYVIVINDCHISDPEEFTTYLNNIKTTLAEAIGIINDIIIKKGDDGDGLDISEINELLDEINNIPNPLL